VKADNAAIAEMERQLTESQDAVRKGRAQLSQLSSDMSDSRDDPKAQKYQELFAKDKEMSELIDNFDSLKATEAGKIESAQAQIVNLLQALSRKHAQAENAGNMNADKFNEMRSDLDFKQMQMDNSVSTSSRLQDELNKRKLELDKIETLDEKITLELQQLQEKMNTMASENEVHSDIRALKESSASKEEELIARKAHAEARGKDMKVQHAKLKKKYEEVKAQLAGDEVATTLDELEQKMRHHEQTVFMLSEYIDTKGAETAFEPIAEECHATIALINAETIRVLAEQPVFAPMAY